MLLKTFWWHIDLHFLERMWCKLSVKVSLSSDLVFTRGNFGKKTHSAFHFYFSLFLHEREGMIFSADKTMGLDSHSSSSFLGWSNVPSDCSPVDIPVWWGEACPTGGTCWAPACRGARPAFRGLFCLWSGDQSVRSSKSLHLQLTGEGSALRTPFWTLGGKGMKTRKPNWPQAPAEFSELFLPGCFTKVCISYQREEEWLTIIF